MGTDFLNDKKHDVDELMRVGMESFVHKTHQGLFTYPIGS